MCGCAGRGWKERMKVLGVQNRSHSVGGEKVDLTHRIKDGRQGYCVVFSRQYLEGYTIMLLEN